MIRIRRTRGSVLVGVVVACLLASGVNTYAQEILGTIVVTSPNLADVREEPPGGPLNLLSGRRLCRDSAGECHLTAGDRLEVVDVKEYDGLFGVHLWLKAQPPDGSAPDIPSGWFYGGIEGAGNAPGIDVDLVVRKAVG